MNCLRRCTGEIFGEQSLVYDAPRNSTVKKATEHLSLYSLGRQDFKEYQKECAIKADASRLHLLLSCNDLKKKLSMDQLRSLVGKMMVKRGEYGQFILNSGDVLREVIVIESGTALVYYNKDVHEQSPEETDNELGIIRNKKYQASVLAHKTQDSDGAAPKRSSIRIGFRKSVDKDSAVAAAAQYRRTSVLLGVPDARPAPVDNGQRRGSNILGFVNIFRNLSEVPEPMPPNPPRQSRRISVTRLELPGQEMPAPQLQSPTARRASVFGGNAAHFESVEESVLQIDPKKGRVACVVEKGCVIGMAVLEGNSLRCGERWLLKEDEHGEGAVSPISIQVTTPQLVYSTFSIATFERLFGKHALKLVSEAILYFKVFNCCVG